MAREHHRLEWRKPGNWIGIRWLRFYHASGDDRVWVPKRVPWLGWTINLAHPAGRVMMLALVLGILAAVASDLGWFGA